MKHQNKKQISWKSVLAGVLTLGVCIVSYASQPQVNYEHGVVEGRWQDGVASFKGIPFAAPPVGQNRWRAPQPIEPWQGKWDASKYGADCMQKPFDGDAAPLGVEPDEDCLYLNVWAPKQAKKRPVLVWIYGGGFVNGGASPSVYRGDQYAQEGVVFVSFNYRIGRFGFFSHPALSAAQEGPLANYGLMDQIAALQWVNRHIEAFGGDPDNVTIMGESAGGESVHKMLQAPQVRGMFHRAIVMSGGGRNLMGDRPLKDDNSGTVSAEQVGLNFAQKMGITGTGKEALQALRDLPASDVVDGLNLAALFTPPGGTITYQGGPVKDGQIAHGTTESLIKAAKVAKVPVMVGATSQDLGFATASSKQELFASFGSASDMAKAAYDPNGHLPLGLLSYLVGQDRTMQEPARFVAKSFSQFAVPTYFYRFSYVAESIRDGQGAQHASEIPFFLNTVQSKYASTLTDKDKAMAAAAFGYVLNFVSKGNPNGEGLPEWSAYDPEKQNLLDFQMDGEPKLVKDPWASRLDAVEYSM